MTSHIPRCVLPLLAFLLLSSLLAAAQSAVDLGDNPVSPVLMADARGVNSQQLEQTRNLRFQECVAAGTRYYENAEFAKALTWYERAQRLEPDNDSLNQWVDSARRNLDQQAALRRDLSSPAEVEKAVKETYRHACDLYEQREFGQARSEFWNVWLLAGNYESTRDYLARIGQERVSGAGEIPDAPRPALSAGGSDVRFAQGKDLLDNEHYDLAAQLFGQVLSEDPDNRKARKLLAKAEKGLRSAREAQAEEEARASLEERERRIEGLLAQAEVALSEGRYDEAKKNYAEVSFLDSNNRVAQRGLEQVDEIRAEAERTANDRRIDEILAQADALFEQQKLDDALKTYQEARALAPQDDQPGPWFFSSSRADRAADGIARVQKELDRVRAAEERSEIERAEIERTQALERQAAEKRKEIDEAVAEAERLFSEGSYEESLRAFETASALAPDDRGVARGTKKAREAVAYAEESRALELERARQDQIDGILSQAASYADAGEFDQAIETYRSVLALDDGNRKAKRGIAHAEKAKTRFEENASAEAALAEETRRREQIADALAQASVLAKSGNCGDAIQAYQSVLTLDPDNRKARRAIAKLEEKKEIAEAQSRETEAAQRKQNRVAQTREGMRAGNEFFASGQYDKAADAFRTVLEIDPRNDGARAALENAKKAQADSSGPRLVAALTGTSDALVVTAVDSIDRPADDIVIAQGEPGAIPPPAETAAPAGGAVPGMPAASPEPEAENMMLPPPAASATIPAEEEGAAPAETEMPEPEAAAMPVGEKFTPPMVGEEETMVGEEETMVGEEETMVGEEETAAPPLEEPAVDETPVAVEPEEMPVSEEPLAPIEPAMPEEPAVDETPVSPESEWTPEPMDSTGDTMPSEAPAGTEAVSPGIEEPVLEGLSPFGTYSTADEEASADEGKDASTLVDEAGILIKEGRAADAIVKLNRALILEPENRKAAKLMAQAEKELEKSMSNQAAERRREIEGLMREADTNYQAKNLADARALWNQVLALDPENKAAKTMLEETEIEHQRLLADEEARRQASETERAGAVKLQTAIPLIRTSEALPLRDFLQTLSLASGVDFTVAEGSDALINGSFVDKTLQEILDSVLLPIGLKWERQKGDIIVVSPDLKTRVFRLNEDQMTKVQALIDNKSIQRLMWGPSAEKPLKGTVLQLEPRQRILIVQDSQQNIEKLDAFLKDLVSDQPVELVTKVYRIEETLGQEIKTLVDAIIQTEKTPFNIERGVWVEGKNLIVRDTPSHMEQIEQMLMDKGFIKNLLDQSLQLATYSLIPRDALKGDTELAQDFALSTKEIIETFLYAEEGVAAAKQAGRRMWFDQSSLQLTITDTQENVNRVASFIASLPQIKQQQLTKVIPLSHVESGEMVTNITQILDLEGGTAEQGAEAGGQSITKSLRTEQEFTYRDLNIRLIRVNENDVADDRDDNCELIVRSGTQSQTITITEFNSTFQDDYEILADDVRPSGSTGEGRVTLKIRYIPPITGFAGPIAGLTPPGVGVAPGAPGTGQAAAEAEAEEGPMRPVINEFGPLNAVIVRYEDPADLQRVEHLVGELDKPIPQVDIMTKFVQVNEQRAKEISSEFTFTDLSDPRYNQVVTGYLDDGTPVTYTYSPLDFIGNVTTVSGGFGKDYDELKSAFESGVESSVYGTNLLKGTTAIDLVLGQFLGTQVENQLRFLEAEGIINVVNGPHIVVMDNESATFEIQRDVASAGDIYDTTVGSGLMQVDMTVSPEVTSAKSILLELLVEISDLDSQPPSYTYDVDSNYLNYFPYSYYTGEQDTMFRRLFSQRSALLSRSLVSGTDDTGVIGTYGAGTNVETWNRQRKLVQTRARIQDGGTIVLGGWTGEYTQDLTSGIPGLRNLPWVGKMLFSRAQKSTYKTTLLIFLSGKIID
ncbi:hypothetical protein JW916_01140 [Candidatus Sumerlaeota bacterium]|nr:hypothetical protein [Candidatus Sumerlaeota bacterium]